MGREQRQTMRSLTPFELDRLEAVEAGLSTVAKLSRGRSQPDATLIAWAKATGRYVRITRPVARYLWGNPYEEGRDGTRAEVIALYARRLDAHPELTARLPALTGMVLCCWCAPARCHGEVLLARLKDGSFERYQAAVEAHRKASTAV